MDTVIEKYTWLIVIIFIIMNKKSLFYRLGT